MLDAMLQKRELMKLPRSRKDWVKRPRNFNTLGPKFIRNHDEPIYPPISLSRRSFSVGGCSMCGPHFCSMRITEDVRKYAAEHAIDESAAIEEGLKQKATEFTKSGSEIYAKT